MMTKILHLIDNIPVVLLLLVALTLGLAPFVPEPHLWEKLKMLGAGTLSKPIDIFDLLLHAIPWIVLLLKLARMAYLKRTGDVS
ncbi:RND transporter [Thiothrix winogradskyi]|uniref:RND transporter n=1 Tax=Thiothrix winogradskyi TaxID=96472 RepID=A0ABY3T394_9GAMM|nr:RND transporter [Thiothrix winogradskyi]UJS26074.1 RND transporter [Thiothrix winogradskyi]